jgi:hypothetical protein
VIPVKSRGLRTVLAVGAAIGVLILGRDPESERGVTSGVLVLAIGAGILVWNITRSGTGGPVS